MKKICDDDLNFIYGGDSISGTVINAFVNVIKVLQEAGHRLGSALRRISEDELCPLK